MSASSSTTSDAVASFDLDDFHGEYHAGFRPAEVEDQVYQLTDPGSARETLHWGRNYLYTSEYRTADGPLEAVVKQFRNQGLRARLRRRSRGSRAESNWRTAIELVEAGIETPQPLMWIESKSAEGPSFFISRRISDFFELRYLIRAMKAGERAERFPQVDEAELFGALGRYLRRIHDAGIWHRDLSIGNVLVSYQEGRPTFNVVDLNRARSGRTLGVWKRSRDLSRLPIVWKAPRRDFLSAYWDKPISGLSLESVLFGFHARAYLLKHWIKNLLRHPIQSLTAAFKPRRAHVHIPEAPKGASSRDKIVWDHLSDQPHQHAGSMEKSKHRFQDFGLHLRAARYGFAAGPRLWRHYRAARKRLYREPVPWDGVGLAVRPWPDDPETPVRMLNELGLRHVLLRLHPWQERHEDELWLARELNARGFDLVFTLPQNRELVRNPRLWRERIEGIAEQFTELGGAFQIGQAVNRSKWGVWIYDEYLDLASSAIEILRAHGAHTLLGPAVIDFEFHALVGLLNLPHPGVHFDAVAHLLYVDRRGAPENEQLGFDTVGKVAAMHGIVEGSRNCDARSWITEFNWPLWEGPHSPAGKNVSVDEEAQADYLVRYYLLTLGTGLVERVYWWQLIARGYGLVAPRRGGELRTRPAYRALATMIAELSGSTFIKPLDCPTEARMYLFERDGEELVVGWSVAEPVTARLPRPAVGAVGRDGEVAVVPRDTEVQLTGSPVYYRLGGPE
jgi:hypothetical protein